MMAFTTALLDWGAGRWDAADERARQELVDRGCQRGINGSLDVVGLVALGRGRLDESRRWFEESLESGDHDGRGRVHPDAALGPRRDRTSPAPTPTASIARCEEGYDIAVRTGERALFIPFVVTGARAYLARAPAGRRRDAGSGAPGNTSRGWDASPGRPSATPTVSCGSPTSSVSAAREALERAVRGWDDRGPGLGGNLGAGSTSPTA